MSILAVDKERNLGALDFGSSPTHILCYCWHISKALGNFILLQGPLNICLCQKPRLKMQTEIFRGHSDLQSGLSLCEGWFYFQILFTSRKAFSRRFLSLGTADMYDRIILHGGELSHDSWVKRPGMLSSIPLEARSTFPVVTNQKCLQTLANVP